MEIILKIIAGLFIYWCIPTLWEKLDDLIDDFKSWLAKRQGIKSSTSKWDDSKYKRQRAKEEKYRKKYPFRSLFKEEFSEFIRIVWYKVPDYPGDFKLWIKTKYQRARRGWANSDAWGFNYYLAKVTKEGCEWLKKNKHGIPNYCDEHKIIRKKIRGYSEDRNFKEAERDWEDILTQIIWTFDVVNKINEHNWFYPHGKTYFTKKELKSAQQLCKKFKEDYPKDDYHVMTLDECRQYRKGWDLFQKHFFDLWD